jgi:ABC-type branched-subunit amino acid transport system ATPase component/ABC-type branched-subunit amino acid transport system permease subunit
MLATALLSQTTLRFVLLGLATGSLTALVALAVVIVYRVSGVLNFAAASLGAIGAFVCYSLRDDWGWPAPVAIGAGLLVGAALGTATYLVMAALGESSLLTRLIATLGLFSAAQGLMIVVWGVEVNQPEPFLPSDNIELSDGLRIGQDRLVLIVLALALAITLRLVYSKTVFGLATSAVAESPRTAASAGWSTGSISLVNYVIAGLLSALAAILLAPIVTLSAAVLSLIILPALAAALAGRFSSFAITIAAAFGIGILQAQLSLFQPDIADAFGVSVPSLTGLSQAVPLLVILVITVLAGRVRPARGEFAARLPLPGSGQVAAIPLVAAVGGGALMVVGLDSYTDALITTFGLAIVICSVVVLSGYAGQLSLCQFALAGFGAWVAARVAVTFEAPFLLALAAGVVATVLVGVLVALPAIRTRGVSLAIVTLALALMFNSLIFTNPAVTGGLEGLVVPTPQILGFEVDPITHPERYGGLLLVALALVGLMVANLRRGAIGRRMIAVRGNERAAASLGISVVATKVYAFAVASGVAAIGGIMLAFRQPSVNFKAFDVFGSILLIQYAVIGGLGWVSAVAVGAVGAPGAVVSQFTLDILPSLDDVASWLAIAAGLGVVSLLRQAPDGVAAQVADAVRGRLPARRTGPAETRDITSDVVAQPVDLRLENISVRFGGVTALDQVSFAVRPGEVLGLIGPNGAGKTTVLDVITGFTRPDTGRVLLDNVDTAQWSPERRARGGMSRSWQAVELFDELTVRDNLLVACESPTRWRYLLDLVAPGRQRLTPFAEGVVDDLGLRDVLDQRPSSLPHGMVRLVGIARAMASCPGVLLLDEPAAGLDARESAELATEIRRIARTHGIGIVVIEHDVPLILSCCDRIVVLDFGRKLAEGSPSEVGNHPDVVHAYLGGASDRDSASTVDSGVHSA